MPANVLVICGPTASGKTALAVELALRHGGEVVSADSMQLYRGMDIGTAKPTQEERKGIPHHMLDVVRPEEAYSVARYVVAASACVDDILARGKLPIIAGGTGLYIDALLKGLEFAPFTGGYRDELYARAKAQGLGPLYKELQKMDPQRAEKLHPKDEKRILRALEVFYETGETITAHDLRTKSKPPRYCALTLALNYACRAELWANIDARVDAMVAAGLEQEVRGLLDAGVSPGCTSMQAIGYKEVVFELEREGGMAQATQEIKLRSRQYAKRQLTWFRRYQEFNWIIWDKKRNFNEVLQNSTIYMEENGLL